MPNNESPLKLFNKDLEDLDQEINKNKYSIKSSNGASEGISSAGIKPYQRKRS